MKFIQVYDKNRRVVQLNVNYIVSIATTTWGDSFRIEILDVTGNKYISLEEPELFKIKIGVESC